MASHFFNPVLLLLVLTPSLMAADLKPTATMTVAGSVKWLAFTADGKAVLGAYEADANGSDELELSLWDAATGKVLAGPVKSRNVSASGAISPDGTTAVTGSYSGNWQIWSLPDLKPGVTGRVGLGRVHRIGFASDSKTFAVLKADYRKGLFDPIKLSRVTYSAYAYETKTGVAVGTAQPWPRELIKGESATSVRKSDPVGWSLGMSPEFGKDGRPLLPTAEQTQALAVPNDFENSGGPAASAISPDRKWAASSGCNGQVVLWDYPARKIVGEPVMQAANLEVLGDYTLLFSPRSDRIAVVRMVPVSNPEGFQPEITLLDVKTRKSIGSPVRPGRTSLLNAMCFSPDGQTLATAFQKQGMGDGPRSQEIQIWNLPAP